MEQNICQMIVHEIKTTCPPDLLAQRNPFIYLIAVKNMVSTGKIGLSLRLSDGATNVILVSTPLTWRELDLLLAHDAEFNSRKVDPEEFSLYLIKTLLPTSAFALYLKRDD